jgi:DNA-directed RNA polymerase specialized sigma24 family protein
VPPSDKSLPLSESDPSLGGKAETLSLKHGGIKLKDAAIAATDAGTSARAACLSPSAAALSGKAADVSPSAAGSSAKAAGMSPNATALSANAADLGEISGGLSFKRAALDAKDAGLSVRDTALGETDAPLDAKTAPLAEVTPLQGVTHQVLRAYLSRPETRRMLMSIVTGKVPPENVEDLVQDAIAEAIETLDRNLPDREQALPAWIATIARRSVADFLAQRTRRAKYEAPMPEVAEAADWDGSGDDRPGRPQPSYDPREDDTKVDAWLVREWLER